MTYNQARNYLRNEGGSINDLTDGQRRAIVALECLDDRNGFDHWFGSLDSTCKTDIFLQLSDSLES